MPLLALLQSATPSTDPASPTAADAGSLASQTLPWLGGLALLAILGGLFVMWLGRRLRAATPPTVGFDLEDLRRLHRAGELTSAEFERAKAAVLAKRPSREELEAGLSRPLPKAGRPAAARPQRRLPPPSDQNPD
jgi:hypothetical protein